MANDDLILELGDEGDVVLEDSMPYYSQVVDYEKLKNKPSINGVTLIGDKAMNDLFADGLILDGGNAQLVTGGDQNG